MKRRISSVSRKHYRTAKTITDLSIEMVVGSVGCNTVGSFESETPLNNDSSETCSAVASPIDSTSELYVSDNEFVLFSSDSESDVEDFVPAEVPANNDTGDFATYLADWAVKYHVPNVWLSALLKLLKMLDPSLPSDARTLLHTPRNVIVKVIEPGKYFHVGIVQAVTKLLMCRKVNCMKSDTTIDLCVNVDGLPIAKSCGSQLWPILCSLYDSPNNVELIGVYQGNEKPKDANLFLSDFAIEAIELSNNGFNFNGKIYSFKVRAFICDAPAKSFIKFIKGHTGYSSCSKCYIIGDYVDNRICFPQLNNLKVRSDTDFKSKVDDAHHTGTSILESIPGFNMITNFPLDYMHLICLGVMRKLLLLWVSGKPPTKLPYIKVTSISEALLNQVPYTAREFARKPRSLHELNRFKATEYRQFLLYTGPVILRSILSADMYLNFVCLHVATLILSNNTVLPELGHYSNSLFKYFVKTFIHIYGRRNVSHNVHNLIHLFEDSQQFGILQNFSSFPFENYLQTFKRLIRKGDRPLPQLIKRKFEQESCKLSEKSTFHNHPQPSMEHNEGPLPMVNISCTQYRQIKFKDFTLKLSKGDNCCCLKDGSIISIKNFVLNSEGLFIVGSKYLDRNELYVKPCKSSCLGIFLVSTEGPLNVWNINEISNKLVKVVCENKIAVFPMLHS